MHTLGRLSIGDVHVQQMSVAATLGYVSVYKRCACATNVGGCHSRGRLSIGDVHVQQMSMAARRFLATPVGVVAHRNCSRNAL